MGIIGDDISRDWMRRFCQQNYWNNRKEKAKSKILYASIISKLEQNMLM